LEPEPLEKKSGAGAAKKFAGSPALPMSTVKFFKEQLNNLVKNCDQAIHSCIVLDIC